MLIIFLSSFKSKILLRKLIKSLIFVTYKCNYSYTSPKIKKQLGKLFNYFILTTGEFTWHSPAKNYTLPNIVKTFPNWHLHAEYCVSDSFIYHLFVCNMINITKTGRIKNKSLKSNNRFLRYNFIFPFQIFVDTKSNIH